MSLAPPISLLPVLTGRRCPGGADEGLFTGAGKRPLTRPSGTLSPLSRGEEKRVSRAPHFPLSRGEGKRVSSAPRFPLSRGEGKE